MQAKQAQRERHKNRGFYDGRHKKKDKSKEKCASCGERGHYAFECKNPYKAPPKKDKETRKPADSYFVADD